MVMPDGTPESSKARHNGGFLATMKAVAWSFFGVRKSRDHEADMAKLNPKYVIIAGVLMCILFVSSLLFIVRLVVGN